MDDKRTLDDMLKEVLEENTRKLEDNQRRLAKELRELQRLTESELRLRSEIGKIAQAVLDEEITAAQAIARLEQFVSDMVPAVDQTGQ